MATIISPNGFKMLLLVFTILTVATIIDVLQDNEIQRDHRLLKYYLGDANNVLHSLVEMHNQTNNNILP